MSEFDKKLIVKYNTALMTRPDAVDRLIIPETTKILVVDPSELIADNPAAEIINTESYDSMDRATPPPPK